MFRRWGFALLLLCPGVSLAQESPEDLLPAGAQIYLRWDGVEAHRAAYEKTALGKMMQGDTGNFITSTFGQLQDTLGAALTVQQLLGGVPPDRLQKMQADAAEAPKLLQLLTKHGVILAAEVRRLEPPEGQITLIIPDVGDQSKPLFATLRLAAMMSSVEVKEKKLANRSVSQIEAGPAQIAWWIEGKHAIVTVGTDPADVVIKRLEGKHARLTGNSLYQQLRGFKQFETGARAFIDVAAIAKIAKTRGKEVAQLIDELGIDGVRSLVFYSGFDGLQERSLMEVDMPGPRKGALKLLTGKPFRLSDVPPLPPDVVTWSMTNFDPGVTYDIALKAVESVVQIAAPDMLAQIKEAIKQADALAGVNIRNDLLAALGDQVLTYNSPAEGPLTLGQTIAVKVKDAKKLNDAVEQIVKNLGKVTGADISLKKKTYRGVELREIHVKQEGFFFTPTYAIYKDWLVIGYFPQPVQGFILRGSGELPGWKPDARLQATFEKLPKEFISVSVSDPVPSMKQLLSLAPVIAGFANSLQADLKLDLSSMPNAHEATRHLFPNITVVTDDGKVLRQETRASLALPFDLSGLDAYGVFLFLGFSSRGF